MSGALAHPGALPHNAEYVGLLSQFSDLNQQAERDHERGGPLLILLSGPEPQRTLLSQKLWAQVQEYNGQVFFVEGREDAPVPERVPPHITHHCRLTAKALKPLLEAASTVICRSGYSTLMDLAALGKRAIIIPTPGQTEQEYLAQMLADRGLFATARQENFSLPTALAQLETIGQRSQNITTDDFRIFYPVVDDWLTTL
jgi:predicted glycosyltransferase